MKNRVNITIDKKTLYIIDEMAKDRGIDRSSMITLCIREKDLKDGNMYCLEYDKENFMKK